MNDTVGYMMDTLGNGSEETLHSSSTLLGGYISGVWNLRVKA